MKTPTCAVLLLVVAAALIGTSCQERAAHAGASHRLSASEISTQSGVVAQEFIAAPERFPMCHASTVAESGDALISAWFAGAHEGAADVSIWVSRKLAGGTWSAPVQVADGVQSPHERFACWNPVLFQPMGGPLQLFYKVGPNPRHWWGMRKISTDNGLP